MTWDFEGDWSKPFPSLEKLNDDGVKNLAIAVIDQAVKSVYRIETKRWKHKLSIGVCSASDAEMQELRDCFYFFRDDFQFYAELAGLEIGTWIKPRGGYFISFDSMPGCAKAIVSMCKDLGVVMTGAGATFPYGKDPKDSNIRIAPTFPSVEEMAVAAKVFVLCVKLVSVNKILAEME